MDTPGNWEIGELPFDGKTIYGVNNGGQCTIKLFSYLQNRREWLGCKANTTAKKAGHDEEIVTPFNDS